jgi:Zn-dependent peptidase ImmA (M78 family)
MKWVYFTFLISLSALAHQGKTIIVEAPSGTYWAKWTSSEEANVNRLIELLQRSKTGKILIQKAVRKAREQGLTLLDVIKPGESSLTDTTLIRKFHPENPESVVFESRSIVYINRHLAWREGILDLAHELTHFVYRENFNPYTVNFSLKDFVKSTIEGRGGEVQSFVMECQVMQELFTRDVQADSNCAQIKDESGAISEKRAAEFFYHVGPFYPQVAKILKERGIESSFPALKDHKIKFVSSAYGVPYPLAAIQEYQTVLSKVCENDRRRLSYMQQGRSPASLEKFRQDLEQRCPRISQN